MSVDVNGNHVPFLSSLSTELRVLKLMGKERSICDEGMDQKKRWEGRVRSGRQGSVSKLHTGGRRESLCCGNHCR